MKEGITNETEALQHVKSFLAAPSLLCKRYKIHLSDLSLSFVKFDGEKQSLGQRENAFILKIFSAYNCPPFFPSSQSPTRFDVCYSDYMRLEGTTNETSTSGER